jgi:demethylmenaquinone methyltransferase/2-methoxy-6-polyprenyl-1,4-benzoquinol methylase
VFYQWVDCDRNSVRQRYDRLAEYIPFFERLLFLPRDFRRSAVDHLELCPGDRVLEIGCGTGRSFSNLYDAVGPAGHIHGIDISPGMLGKAQALCDANRWSNIELNECDAAEYSAPAPLDGVLFSLSYNTMPHHRAVLRHAWDQLRPGGQLVIMDAKLPPGRGGQLILPFCLWLMKHTMLGNPLIEPWKELAAVAEHIEMNECLFGSYYICRGMKPFFATGSFDADGVLADAASLDVAHRIAAE